MRPGRPRIVYENPDDPAPGLKRSRACPRGHLYTVGNTYRYAKTGSIACRECGRERERDFRKKLYGITLEQYAGMVEAQEGGCAICGVRDSDDVALGVDHDHKTKAIRGVLCSGCNAGLGHFRDNVERLERAIAYLNAFRSRQGTVDTNG